jgi:outer membrane protein OmpA-like peptidoglycan-associated protein
MLGGRAGAVWLAITVGCASSGRAPPSATAPEDVPPSGRAPEEVTPQQADDEAERVKRRREEIARLKSSLERDAELAAEREVCDSEREQEEARRWLGCHPHRAARMRFAAGSVALDRAGRAAVDALVRRWQKEPGAYVIVLGAQRSDEGEEFTGIDRRRAHAVRDALLARGVAARQIVAAAEFRAPVVGREEVEVVWVCEVCCVL